MKNKTALLALALAFAIPAVPVLAEDGPNYIEEMKRWQPKAETGDAEAQFQLGQMYALGHGFKQNYRTAAEWYEKAAEQGNAKARTALGLLYYYGMGVETDMKKAGELFEKSAVQDEPVAQRYLGFIATVNENYTEAKQWWEQAVVQNYAPAMMNIGFLYKEGKGVDKDIAEAKKWFDKAISQKKPSGFAMYALAQLYCDGDGVEKNEQQAVKLLQEACNMSTFESGPACSELAKYYLEGKMGLPKDEQQAFNYAMKAAERGHVEGAQTLRDLAKKGFSFPETERKRAETLSEKSTNNAHLKSLFVMQMLQSLQE